jgi:hypothetical protein
MTQPEKGAREVAIPATALAALDRALTEHAGSLARLHTLHAAGYEAGRAFWASFDRPPRGPSNAMPARRFWPALSRFLEARGWGSLTHESAHPGVGLLLSRDLAESAERNEPQPVCAFTTGLLAHLLTRTAGQPVAVLEVTCRARGDEHCTFAFGSEATVHDLYGLLLEGGDLGRALEGL